jgi:HTH-type transcriptional regulator/antitoxin HigA
VRSEEELGQYKSWASAFPVKDLVRHNLIKQGSSHAATVGALLRYFGMSNPDAWTTHWLAPAVSFRASPTYQSSPHATAAWLRWGELLAEQIATEPFDPTRLRDVLQEVRPLTRRDLPLIQQRVEGMFASAGVAFVLTPELSRVRLSGAARWLTADKAMIQLSLRHKTDDQLWFTVFHEARHLLGRKRVDFLDDESRPDDGIDDDEADADRFARDVLIPASDYEAFVEQGAFTASAIRAFAKSQDIAPGIVVGRLQREHFVPRSHHDNLKKRLSFVS